jgi:hypothetical protein
MLHSLSEEQGFDVFMTPIRFLPANADASGLILIDNTAYVGTANDCGGVANGVWALGVSVQDKTVIVWKTNGGSVAGTAGPAFGTDGAVYAATADGDYGPANFSDSVVALDPKTLRLKDFFSPAKSAFNATPVVFAHGGRDLIAATNSDGRLYLLDSASLGGADHRTPLAVSAKYVDVTTDYTPGALASWQDAGGTQWILVAAGGAVSGVPAAGGNATNGAIVAFRVADQGGKPTLQPAWVSRDMMSPLPPIVVDGVVFAVAGGEFRSSDASITGAQRAQRSASAVLYALDGTTGRELWNSGTALTSYVSHTSGLSEQFGTVYVATADNVLWSFGFPQHKQ